MARHRSEILYSPAFLDYLQRRHLFWQHNPALCRTVRGDKLYETDTEKLDLFPSGKYRAVILLMRLDDLDRIHAELGSSDCLFIGEPHITIPEFMSGFTTPNSYFVGFDRKAPTTKFHITYTVLHNGQEYRLRVYGDHNLDSKDLQVYYTGVDCKRVGNSLGLSDDSIVIAEQVWERIKGIYSLPPEEFANTIFGKTTIGLQTAVATAIRNIPAERLFVAATARSPRAVEVRSALPIEKPYATKTTDAAAMAAPGAADRRSELSPRQLTSPISTSMENREHLDKLEELFRVIATDASTEGDLEKILKNFEIIFTECSGLSTEKLEQQFLKEICVERIDDKFLFAVRAEILAELRNKILQQSENYFKNILNMPPEIVRGALKQLDIQLQTWRDLQSTSFKPTPRTS